MARRPGTELAEGRAAAEAARGEAAAEAVDAANGEVELDLVAERIRAAWRDLRRAGSTAHVRTLLYAPDPPLDVAQADALDLVVSHGPVRMSEAASLLRVDPSTATRTIAKLQDRGLVQREHDPDDARAVLVAPSRRGTALHLRVRARANQLLAETLEAFTPADRERLAELMEQLVVAVDARRDQLDPSAGPT